MTDKQVIKDYIEMIENIKIWNKNAAGVAVLKAMKATNQYKALEASAKPGKDGWIKWKKGRAAPNNVKVEIEMATGKVF